jgi:hypothetical protein
MDASCYRAEIISDIHRIIGLTNEVVPTFCEDSDLLAPQFFLDSVEGGRWHPQVVVVRRGTVIAGVVYTKERRLLGFRTGLIHGDSSRSPLVLSHPHERENVLNCALEFLLARKGVLGIRLEIPDTELGMCATTEFLDRTGVVASQREFAVNSTLSLSSSYDALLSQMGAHTRRNFRYYRRQFEQSGNRYSEAVPIPDVLAATKELTGKSSIPADRANVEYHVKMCLAARRPMLAGLRASDGEWLAIVGGWYAKDQATVLFQMNRDQERQKESLSLVLRGYLIESLIQEGFRSIVFLGGVSEPLKRYCCNVPILILYLDRAAGLLSPARLLKLAARLAPSSMASKAPWISNPCG